MSQTNIRLTIVYDNYNGAKSGFMKSFGFAVLIEKNDKKILFDTGTKTDPLTANLESLGVSLRSLDAVILSHNHYDHTDGLPEILLRNPDIPVYVHQFWDKPVRAQGIYVPQKNRVTINSAREIKEISSGLFITGALISPDYGGIYEQSVYIKAPNSYILLCGCCHPGLNACLNERLPLNIPQNATLNIMGGLHGSKFSNDEAKHINTYVESIILCHCTKNTQLFKNQFGEKCRAGILGEIYYF